MSILNTNTLVEFENQRKLLNHIPLFDDTHQIGESTIELQPVRTIPTDYRFDIEIKSKTLNLGNGEFVIAGDIVDIVYPYRNMLINKLATLVANNKLLLRNPNTGIGAQLIINGYLEINENGTLSIESKCTVYVPISGTLALGIGSSIDIGDTGKLSIFGTLIISPHLISKVIGNSNITISPLATILISEPMGSRLMSISDYIAELNKVIQPPGSSSFRAIANFARASFSWVDGNPLDPSHIIAVTLEKGTAYLGDFTTSIFGVPQEQHPYLRVVSTLIVNNEATLIIGSDPPDNIYYQPSLYIGQYPFIPSIPGIFDIDGNVILLNGFNITYKNGGTIHIREQGVLTLQGTSKLINKGGSGNLVIDGKLVINDLSQLDGSTASSITFGSNGKLMVLNPSPINVADRKLLLSIPNGIQTSTLYKLFKDRLKYIEFHIQHNCGIRIDRDMEATLGKWAYWDDWYGGMRLARAIHDKYLIWHDGGYIELNRSQLPWVTATTGLSQGLKIFKSYHIDEKVQTQELATRMKYAGSGNITFRYVNGAVFRETTLNLKGCNIINVGYDPISDHYTLIADSDGLLFIRSKIPSGTLLDIINLLANKITIPTTMRTTFQL